jgi:hypothetical protein
MGRERLILFIVMTTLFMMMIVHITNYVKTTNDLHHSEADIPICNTQ